jgi:hypothetical protein
VCRRGAIEEAPRNPKVMQVSDDFSVGRDGGRGGDLAAFPQQPCRSTAYPIPRSYGTAVIYAQASKHVERFARLSLLFTSSSFDEHSKLLHGCAYSPGSNAVPYECENNIPLGSPARRYNVLILSPLPMRIQRLNRLDATSASQSWIKSGRKTSTNGASIPQWCSGIEKSQGTSRTSVRVSSVFE